jgi:hypothetical protein
LTGKAILRRLKSNVGFAVFLGVIALILVVLSGGESFFSRSDDPSTPTPEPILTTDQLASATGTIEVVHLVPAPADPGDFNLSIDGPTGTAGPGPTQTATGLALGAHSVSVVPAAGATNKGPVSLLGVVCTSDKGVAVQVEPALAVVVHLTRPDEKITCVFQSKVTPIAPTPTPTAAPTTAP